MARFSNGVVIDKMEELTALRKAAVLVLALEQETAAALLKAMSHERVEQISREIAGIERIAPNVRETVVREFYNLVLARTWADSGGLSFAKSLLSKTLPPDESRRIISTIEHQVHAQPFSFLQKTEKENLITFIAEEHPQTIALILSHLPPAMASEILVGLPKQRQVEVMMRIAHMDQTSPEIIEEVERGLEKRLAGLVSEHFERVGGVEHVAEILNTAGRAAERSIMEGLESEDADLVESIRRLMFVFEDVLRVNDKGIQAVLKEVENEELALSLKSASDELKNKIFSNMSERAATLIREEMEFMGAVRVSDVEAAQQKVVDVVRRLEDAGEVVIAGKGGDSDMVT